MFGTTITREAKPGRSRSQFYPTVPFDPGVCIDRRSNAPTIGNTENIDYSVNIVTTGNTGNTVNTNICRNTCTGENTCTTTAWDGQNTARFGS